MSHEVETMAWTGHVPWHGLGFEVSNDLTPEEMLVAAQLDWTVSKRPMFFQKEEGGTAMKRAHGSHALVRDSDNSLLSTIGDNWKPIQNRESIGFFKDFVEAGNMKMETAGSLRGGKFIWALARLEESFKLGKSAEGDVIHNYLLLSSPHHVGHRFVIQYTPVRVVCKNTLNFALGGGLKGNNTGYHQTHATAFDVNAKMAAEKALGLVNQQIIEFRAVAERLAAVRLAESKQREFFMEVMEVQEAEEGEEEQRDPRLLKHFETALIESPGATMDTARGTLWGGVNAFSYLADHQMGRERDTALASAWFGSASVLKRRALNVAMDWAKAA